MSGRGRGIFATERDFDPARGPFRRPLTEEERHQRIWDSLRYYGDDDGVHRRLAFVVAALPARVARFAIERCVFLSIGRTAHGITYPGRIARRPWLILLSEKLPAASADGIIAHEIAHAWYGHDRYAPTITPACEVEAATLTRSWGFRGIGADPMRNDRQHGRWG